MSSGTAGQQTLACRRAATGAKPRRWPRRRAWPQPALLNTAGLGAGAQEKEERQRKKARLAARSKLSFAGDDEEGEDGEDGGDDDDDENGDANGKGDEDEVVWMTDTSEAAAQVCPLAAPVLRVLCLRVLLLVLCRRA